MTLAHTLDGRGPARVVLLHDWLGDAGNYDAALPYFDLDALTLARVDLPGYGASRDLPLRSMDAGALEAEVLAVADHLGWGRFHLVAHSMSTVIAQRLARSHPSRLAGVTLTAPVAPGTHLPDEALAFLRALGGTPGIRRDALAARANPHLSAPLARPQARALGRLRRPGGRGGVRRPLRAPSARDDARVEGAAPVLAITGADDGESPSAAPPSSLAP